MSKYNKAMQTIGVGGGGGAVVMWFWGVFMPEQPMPPEVAAIIAGCIGAVANALMPANSS